MNSQYFAQYLLNAGILSSEKAEQLLQTAQQVKAEIPLLALMQGILPAEEAQALLSAGSEGSSGLTEAQIRNLKEMVTDEGCRFAQAMLDTKITDLVGLAKMLAEYEQRTENPVWEAVKLAAGREIEEELAYYSEYAELFLQSMVRFMDLPGIIDIAAMPYAAEQPSHLVSQRMSGDVNMVGGVQAEDAVFLELSRRYSRENLQAVDLMSIDSVGEFLNVMNGLFAVKLGKRQLDVDLELPRWEKNIQPEAMKLLKLSVMTAAGRFCMVLSADEFL